MRIVAKGPNRISELSEAWKKLLATAEIDNQSGIESAGLIALTSIAFSDNSATESVLLVPAQTYVLQDDSCYLVSVSTPDAPAELEETGTEFEIGSQPRKGFVAAVERALEQISQGKLEKVVLARDLVMPIGKAPNLAEPLARLRSRYPHCWVYKVDRVFGASPELLLRADHGEVSARVLAGTAGRGTDPDVDRAIADGLAHSMKNKHEHDYAVQSLVSELEPICDFVEADSEPFSLALPDLWHLATDVRGVLRDGTSLLDAIARLHPTAAVAGTPRDKGLELISELEPFDRAGYAGPVGWLSSTGSGEIAIALRGGVIEDKQIRAMAGCGIVSESDPAAELAETELKFQAVRWAFSN
jgi:menaquinone-specific isochorismate synthase